MSARLILFDDTYHGPRWRYGLTLRPITQYTGASGLGEWIVFSGRPSDDARFPHGTIDYPCEIPEDIARTVDLGPLGMVEGTDYPEPDDRCLICGIEESVCKCEPSPGYFN